MKKFIQCFLIFLTMNAIAKPTFVEQHKGNQKIQGLSDVNQIAKSYMQEFNQKHGGKWQSLEPNAKILQPKCNKPLTASWDRLPHDKYWQIKVSCHQTINKNLAKWDILVPTNRPYILK